MAETCCWLAAAGAVGDGDAVVGEGAAAAAAGYDDVGVVGAVAEASSTATVAAWATYVWSGSRGRPDRWLRRPPSLAATAASGVAASAVAVVVAPVAFAWNTGWLTTWTAVCHYSAIPASVQPEGKHDKGQYLHLRVCHLKHDIGLLLSILYNVITTI